MSLTDGISGLLDDTLEAGEKFVKTPIGGAITAAAAGGVIAGTVLGSAGAIKSGVTASRKKKAKKKTARGRARDRKYISKQKHEQAYVKRKKRAGKKITRTGYKGKSYSSKRTTKKRVGKIYKTKNGQPYKILASGKAKFIKKR